MLFLRPVLYPTLPIQTMMDPTQTPPPLGGRGGGGTNVNSGGSNNNSG
ncbi:hypothetical protein A2U01_0105165, partial [Trifolium medium]|nr:hypothetical protein [Trifolium medium]